MIYVVLLSFITLVFFYSFLKQMFMIEDADDGDVFSLSNKKTCSWSNTSIKVNQSIIYI